MFKRFNNLVEEVRKRYPDDSFFADFESSCKENRLKREFYQSYEDAIVTLKDSDWTVLKGKAIRHFKDHRIGQLKTGLFAQLNEAFAYRYLLSNGFQNVTFLSEGKTRTPDIEFKANDKHGYCEVKSIGISDDEINRRSSQRCIDGSVYAKLSPEFFHKMETTVSAAIKQIGNFGGIGIIYLIVEVDDFTHDYLTEYRRQFQEFVRAYPPGSLFLQLGYSNEIITI